MNKELIFNIFPIINNNVITKIGYRVHEFSGNDNEKIDFLQSSIYSDLKNVDYIHVPSDFTLKFDDGTIVNGISHDMFNNILQNSNISVLFEPIYLKFKASNTPLCVITMVEGNEIKISEQVTPNTDLNMKIVNELQERIPQDYFVKYQTENGLDLIKLLDSDFLDSIKILFEKGKYTSSIKLLMSAVDTFSYIEYGDINNSFKIWLNTYCELNNVKVSADEIWEFRNAILHMTNPFSRKVISKKIKTLYFYIHDQEIDFLNGNGEVKYFNYKILFDEILEGIKKWGDSYNQDREKIFTFIERYDSIMSDSRYNTIEKLK